MRIRTREAVAGLVCVAACLLPGAGPLAQEADSIVARELAPSLWVIDGAIDRIGVLATTEGTLFVDGGYAETVAGVRAAIARIGARAPSILVNTHWHHAFANAAFDEDAVIVGHASLAGRLSRANDMAGREIPSFPPAALPDVAFRDSLLLRLGDEEVRLVAYPNAHTESDVVVFLRGGAVVFTGDLFVPHMPWVDVAAGGDAHGWLAAIDALIARVPEDAVLVPGHDRIGDASDLREFRALLAAAIDAVEAGIAAGHAPEAIVAAGLPARWDAWERVIPASMFLETVHRSLTSAPDRSSSGPAAACRYVGGRWWDGSGFVQRTMHVRDGMFVEPPSGGARCEVDLAGLRIVPPYGDAHRHDLADSETIEEQMAVYLGQGVFYAMEQDPIHEVGADVRAIVSRPETVDVAYTQGVIAPSWSSIAGFYRSLAGQGEFGERRTLDSLDGREIFVVDDADDVARHWPTMDERNDAFVKVILAFSEDFERRSSESFRANPPGPAATAGLDPALLPELVRRAHGSGLRVSVHIETAEDFRRAVAAGADVVAHLPGAWQVGPATGFSEGDLSPWLLEPADARAAAARGAIVVTTIQRGDSVPREDDADRIHRHNLRLLEEHGVRVAIGSDGFEPIVLAPGEALYLHRLGVAEPAELLRVLTETTPRAIFPERRIGRLEPGWEASFLALAGDPLVDPRNLGAICLALKQGHRLPVQPAEACLSP